MSTLSVHPQFQKISGVFADVDFTNETEDTSFKVSSLKELSASTLVSDISLLCDMCSIPARLQDFLMHMAVKKGLSPTINLLLRTWPNENLCITLPYVCRTWKIFLKNNLEDLPLLSDSATTILRNFIQSKSRLKYLDLSALPLVDSQVSIICSLAISEVPTSTDPHLVVYLNCYVQEQLSLELLITALESQKAGRSRLKLVLRALHVSPEGCLDEIHILFHFLDPLELKQCSFEYCLGFPTNMDHIFKVMESFRSLKVLCLQYVTSPIILKSLLNQLVNLERLDIQGIHIKNNLEFFLSSMCQQCHHHSSNNGASSFGSKLKFLDLSDCLIFDRSILYLARSPHAQSLLTLNLTTIQNRLNLSSVLTLLKACKNLRVLQLENNRFDVENLNPLFEILPSLDKLKYLNIALRLKAEDLFSAVPFIREMPNLVDLRIKFPAVTPLHDTAYTVESFTEEYRSMIESLAPFKKINVQVVMR